MPRARTVTPRLEAPRGTQAVIRAIRLLKAFSPARPELTLAELCAEIGLSKTTTHRLLSALLSEGLVVRRGARNSYQLGPEVIALGSQALLTSDLRKQARPTLEALAVETGETATLEVRAGDQMLVLDGVDGRHLISAHLDIGTRWPIHATSTGKCVLAHLPEALREVLLRSPLQRFTENTVTSPERLRSELGEIRSAGFSVAYEELEVGYVGVAAEVRGPLGEVEGAICIGGPASRLTRRQVQVLGPSLRSAADRISGRHEAGAGP